VAVLLGVLVALSYGAGDFLGGLGTRAQSVFTVVAASQASALALLVVVVPLEGVAVRWGDVGLGALSGVIGVVGVLLLYQGLATGAMGVVAPVTAVGAAVVPLGVGLATGERPAVLALVGAVVALAAVALVASGGAPGGTGPVEGDGRRAGAGSPLLLAVGAGVAFGLVFVLLGATDDEAGFWPLLGARTLSVSLLAAWLVRTRVPFLPRPGTRLVVVGAGLLDVTANALYLLAVREGLLSLVAVLSSLYPVATVVLARFVLGERLQPTQLAGLGLGLAGVTMIAAA
jgi:drug/metabolite transporter (DMT)-like permease